MLKLPYKGITPAQVKKNWDWLKTNLTPSPKSGKLEKRPQATRENLHEFYYAEDTEELFINIAQVWKKV